MHGMVIEWFLQKMKHNDSIKVVLCKDYYTVNAFCAQFNCFFVIYSLRLVQKIWDFFSCFFAEERKLSARKASTLHSVFFSSHLRPSSRLVNGDLRWWHELWFAVCARLQHVWPSSGLAAPPGTFDRRAPHRLPVCQSAWPWIWHRRRRILLAHYDLLTEREHMACEIMKRKVMNDLTFFDVDLHLSVAAGRIAVILLFEIMRFLCLTIKLKI